MLLFKEVLGVEFHPPSGRSTDAGFSTTVNLDLELPVPRTQSVKWSEETCGLIVCALVFIQVLGVVVAQWVWPAAWHLHLQSIGVIYI